MENTIQAPTTSAPASSAMPTASVPSSVSQPVNSAPSSYQAQAPLPQMSMEQHPAYQPQAAPQASAPAANPWQEAFQALSASLNTPQASQAPAQFSAYQTPTPQANTQASWNSTLSQTPSAAQAQQIYGAPASTQAYSAAGQQQQMLAQAQAQAVAQQQAMLQAQSQSASASDSYLSAISDNSLEVLEHFGAEALPS